MSQSTSQRSRAGARFHVLSLYVPEWVHRWLVPQQATLEGRVHHFDLQVAQNSASRERGGQVREGIRVREITNDEGKRLLQIVRRSSGSVVRWRRAQMVLLSAQGMDVAQIAKVAFTSPDRVRAVLHNFNDDGFDSLAPKYSGGRPPTFTLPERREIKKIALSRPVDHDLPFSTWSLTKLAEFLVAEGVVDDISHEGLRLLLREEGVSFQVIKTWKQSNDPDFEAKKNRVLELYEIADGKAKPKKGDPTVVICMDEFGPLNLLPRPGKQWAPSDRRRERRPPKTHGADGAGPPTRARRASVISWPPTT